MLDGARDPDGHVELRRDELSGTADLSIHWQPSRITHRPGRGDFGTEGGRQPSHEVEMLGLLDASTDRDNAVRAAEIDGLARLAERCLDRLARLRQRHVRRENSNWRIVRCS